jgi:hypothetical protein
MEICILAQEVDRPIQAINAVRSVTGLGLRDAKAVVDQVSTRSGHQASVHTLAREQVVHTMEGVTPLSLAAALDGLLSYRIDRRQVAHLQPGFLGDADSLLSRAFEFACDAHFGQMRKVDGQPFINHPIRVAARLHNAGYDDVVVAAGFLHDVDEDTDRTIAEIRAAFGDDVAGLVDALSEDKTIPDYHDRKHHALDKLRAGGELAGALFAADKLENFLDFALSYDVEGEALGDRFNAGLDDQDRHLAEKLLVLDKVAPVNVIVAKLREAFVDYLAVRAQRTGRPRVVDPHRLLPMPT